MLVPILETNQSFLQDPVFHFSPGLGTSKRIQHPYYCTPSLGENLTVRPLKMGRNPQGNDRLPTMNFRCYVKFCECIYSYQNVLLPNVAFVDPNISPNFFVLARFLGLQSYLSFGYSSHTIREDRCQFGPPPIHT